MSLSVCMCTRSNIFLADIFPTTCLINVAKHEMCILSIFLQCISDFISFKTMCQKLLKNNRVFNQNKIKYFPTYRPKLFYLRYRNHASFFFGLTWPLPTKNKLIALYSSVYADIAVAPHPTPPHHIPKYSAPCGAKNDSNEIIWIPSCNYTYRLKSSSGLFKGLSNAITLLSLLLDGEFHN